jgi:oligosaccharide repeat unit polymerase
MFSATPVLACWGLIGARVYSKVYLLATAGAVASTLVSPSRTTIVQLALTAALFGSYVWRAPVRTTHRPTLRKVVPALAAVALGAVLLSYFTSTTAALGKDQGATNIYHGYGVPDHLISPVLYTVGGLSALTVAIDNGINPLERYGSVFSLIRVWRGVDPSVTAPNTIGRFVPIPGDFNVYTGFGQAYFDFGWLGAFLFPAFVAWVVVSAHRRALRASPRAMLVASVAGVAAINMLLENTFFNLGVSFQLVLGFVLFGWIRVRVERPEKSANKLLRAYPVPTS